MYEATPVVQKCWIRLIGMKYNEKGFILLDPLD